MKEIKQDIVKRIGSKNKRLDFYQRYCVRCEHWFTTESRSRGKRVCPNCRIKAGRMGTKD